MDDKREGKEAQCLVASAQNAREKCARNDIILY